MTLLTIQPIDVAKRTWFWLFSVGAVVVAIWMVENRSEPPSVLAPWTDVAALVPAPRGLDWGEVTNYPTVNEALRGFDPDALRRSLDEAGLDALWVGVTPESPWGPELPLADRFAAGGVIRGFRGVYLTPEGMLYAVDRTVWPEALAAHVLGPVARQILEGHKPPSIDAFPEALAREQSIEVLVLLRGPNGVRLWRSARAESIAEGLNTAALAARKRWDERRETMGGPLEDRLDQLDVEVALLFDDGTLDGRAVSLIDSLVKPLHGVAYEQPARWRYLLPTATHDGRSPSEAYRQLFIDNGLPEESFDRADLRLYRMRMKTLSVDHGSAGSRRGGVPSGSDEGSSSGSESRVSKEESGSSAGSRTTNVVPTP
jgi:hypothetical protein